MLCNGKEDRWHSGIVIFHQRNGVRGLSDRTSLTGEGWLIQ